MSTFIKKDTIFKLVYKTNIRVEWNYTHIEECKAMGLILNDGNLNVFRIFGKEFVKNNKKNCRIIYNNKIYELKEYLKDIDKEYKNKNLINLKLIIINDIINMSKIFYECYHLLSISEYSKKKNNQNIIILNDNFLVYNLDSNSNKEKCSNVCTIINDTFDIYNEKNLSSLSLSSIHNNNNIVSSEHKNTDILNSPPKLNKIIDLSGMFSFCLSLEFLPDLSIWNISKVREMNYIFFYCKCLKSLPDISKWDTSNVIDMSYMFYNCNLLISLPDISKWNTSNVKI